MFFIFFIYFYLIIVLGKLKLTFYRLLAYLRLYNENLMFVFN